MIHMFNTPLFSNLGYTRQMQKKVLDGITLDSVVTYHDNLNRSYINQNAIELDLPSTTS